MACEHVRRSGLDADADERKQPLLLPVLLLGELVVAELDVRLLVRVHRVGLRECHRHVEIGDAGPQAGVEDLWVEARVRGVQNCVRLDVCDKSNDRVLVRGVETRGAEAVVFAEFVDDGLRSRRVEIGKHDALEERATLRNRGEGGADAPCPDDQDPHGEGVLPERPAL